MSKDENDGTWLTPGRALRFEARLIDAGSGEVVVAVDLATTLTMEAQFGALRGDSLLSSGVDTPELRSALAGAVMARLAEIIAKRLCLSRGDDEVDEDAVSPPSYRRCVR